MWKERRTNIRTDSCTPETIGSIAYLRKRHRIKGRVIAGFNLTCVGDDRAYSYVCSPSETTIADEAIKSGLHKKQNVCRYSYNDRGSDERQYCSPLIDLPLISFSRTKFHEYTEYHTNKDNLDLVSINGLKGSYEVMKSIIDAFEEGLYPVSKICVNRCTAREMYPTMSSRLVTKGKHI